MKWAQHSNGAFYYACFLIQNTKTNVALNMLFHFLYKICIRNKGSFPCMKKPGQPNVEDLRIFIDFNLKI